jgi:serine/threonine-protein kinase
MELVPGENLAERVQRLGPQPTGPVLRLLDQALDALEHAHRLRLVHRDLKPENMLLEPDGRLRITDFGLALALQSGSSGGATSRSGTPQYAAPEQLLGERVDERADLYALGAVAYFALLGHAPFQGASPEAILAGQTIERLPALAERRPDVSAAIETTLRRALASEPSQRYPSAASFREALRTLGEAPGP